MAVQELRCERKSVGGFLGWVERVGNKIPHPFILFLWLILIVWIASAVCAFFGVSVINPSTKKVVVVKSLLSAEGITYILKNMIKNFTGFAPLGLVLTMTLGIGLAEQVGLISSFMRSTMLNVSPKLVTFSILIIGICGNIASDAAIIIVPAVAGMIFASLGRHPFAGIAIGYASTTAGFSANLIISGTDVLLGGITNEAMAIVDKSVTISPAANYYFILVSTVLLAIVGTLVTEKIIEPRLGKYNGKKEIITEEVTKEEKAGLRKAGWATLVYMVGLIAILIPKTSFLRNPKTHSLVPSPFLDSLIPFILFLFILISIVYGKEVGKIKSMADIPKYMSAAITGMSSYIVLVFVIGQFIAHFNWSNLGYVLAVKGADLLSAANFTGIPLFIGFVILTAFINLFIGSGSAKWSLLAPIFVPMFYMLGYSPALTQVLYRIGDSPTNIISPLFPYFPIILEYFNEYDEDAGVGTVLSMMIPYSIAMLIGWILLAIVWYLIGIPLGPGAPVR
ncbi:AbgT family transporter [Clostridium lundense]|uniref:AbgT family transporter n=1 Tax=Clostridium lundense TaxID=319475 RepID=UPI00047F71F5|nr:AbgT family transporter [Clostridium lundense]